DPSSNDAAYQAKLSFTQSGQPVFQDEHVLIGHDPFTGKPFAQAPDIIFHELTHRINSHIIPGFGTSPNSRVVDESIADTFASAIDGNWTIGEGTVPGGMRSLAHPESQQMLFKGDRVKVKTPTTFAELTEANQQYGPYYNIGPLNHAAYL